MKPLSNAIPTPSIGRAPLEAQGQAGSTQTAASSAAPAPQHSAPLQDLLNIAKALAQLSTTLPTDTPPLGLVPHARASLGLQDPKEAGMAQELTKVRPLPPHIAKRYEEVAQALVAAANGLTPLVSGPPESQDTPAPPRSITAKVVAGAAATKSLGMVATHGVEKAVLELPSLLQKASKSMPSLNGVAAHLPTPITRSIGLIVPWLLEPSLTAHLRQSLGIKTATDEQLADNRRTQLATGAAGSIGNWNHAQPTLRARLAGAPPATLHAAGLAATGSISAMTEAINYLTMLWRQNQGSGEARSGAAPMSPQKNLGGAVGGMTRMPVEFFRQLYLMDATAKHTPLYRAFEQKYPGYMPVLTMAIKEFVAQRTAQAHPAAAAAEP